MWKLRVKAPLYYSENFKLLTVKSHVKTALLNGVTPRVGFNFNLRKRFTSTQAPLPREYACSSSFAKIGE